MMMMIGCTIHFFSFFQLVRNFIYKKKVFISFDLKLTVYLCLYICVCVCVQPKHDLCISTLTLTLNYFVSFFGQFQFFFLLNRSFDWLFGWWSVSSGGEFSHFFFLLILEPKKKVFSVFVWLHNKKKKKKSSIWSIKKKNGRTD